MAGSYSSTLTGTLTGTLIGAGFEALVDLPVVALQIVTSAQDPIALPEMAGSSLRGAFGAALKRLVCVRTDLSQCAPCPHLSGCAYPYLFETRSEPGAAGATGFESLPRPYVIRSPAGAQSLQVDEPLVWQMVLIGKAIPLFPYIALSWQEMGRVGIGRGKGRFRLERAASLDLNGAPVQPLYDRQDNLLHSPAAVIGPEALDRWLRESGASIVDEETAAVSFEIDLEFLTPTSIKHQGGPAATPQFHVVWRNLQRRLSMLRLGHGGGRPETDFAATIAAAEGVALVGWETRPMNWERYSRRQGQRVPMQGFVGTARYRGNLGPFLPALLLGSVVGVGDNCTFGQGQYRLRVGT